MEKMSDKGPIFAQAVADAAARAMVLETVGDAFAWAFEDVAAELLQELALTWSVGPAGVECVREFVRKMVEGAFGAMSDSGDTLQSVLVILREGRKLIARGA